MKQAVLILLIFTLVAALLLLLWSGAEGLQGIYLWIAEQENAARGIDGITEASRLKVMDDAIRHFAIYRKVCKALFLIALLFFCLDGKRRLDRMEH
ncbi:MAG: hypothetical protein IJ570_05010 [Prevotella sp.]|nr:hypothetical protein [Bacteroidaceae bacterium]MBR1415206.1 hypothetical protein [Prevotella sp.]